MLGGRTNHWGRISLRYGPDDFRRKSLDGLGDDWPITYDDIKPYYDKVDTLVGIFGSDEGLPNEPDGIFQPAPRPRCYELLIKQAADRLKITCIAVAAVDPDAAAQRSPGLPLLRPVRARLRGARELLVAVGAAAAGAQATGRLTLVTGAMAREVTVDDAGLASGVSYIDTATGRENHVRARIVVLAASACESARLLLNSKSSKFPQGLANSSGVVGRYLTDSTGTSVERLHPEDDGQRAAQRGRGERLASLHAVVARQQDARLPARLPHRARRRPPHAGLRRARQHPSLRGQPTPTAADPGRRLRQALKDDYRRFYGATVGFAGRGEMIPNPESYCEIDPSVVDQWGIPVLRFHFKWTDHEFNQVRHMQQTFRAIIERDGRHAARRRCRRAADGYGIEPGGRIIHEIGVVRMGNDPISSALNKHCQAHDVKNLFVADGAPFVSQPGQERDVDDPRAGDEDGEYIADQRKGGGSDSTPFLVPRFLVPRAVRRASFLVRCCVLCAECRVPSATSVVRSPVNRRP